MTKRKYKKKCKALFKKAKKLGVKLNFSPDDFDCDRLDCLWYGGHLAGIEISETLTIALSIYGDVRACLNDENGCEVASVRDKCNAGFFKDEMLPYIETDEQLFEVLENDRLTLDNNNWIEYDGIIKNSKTDDVGYFVDLGMLCDNILDNNILVAIEQALDSLEEIKNEILGEAEMDDDIEVSDV